MIYLASPYSHKSPAIEQYRFEAARDYVIEQMQKGVNIFSPIVYGHQFALAGKMPGDHKTWLAFNMHMLKNSTEIYILCLEGANRSAGVQYETDRSIEWNIPLTLVYV